MKLRGALFDFDGTLLSNGQYHISAVQAVFEKYVGESIDSEKVRQLTGLPYYDKLVHLLAERGIDDDAVAEDLNNQAREYYRDNHSVRDAVIPGVPELLQQLLDAGVTLAVVTSASRSHATDHLQRAGLAQFFTSVTGGDDVQWRKPHPEPYLVNLERHGLEATNTVVFEDSPPGLAAGIAAKMSVIALLTNFSADELPGAALHIPDYTTLTVEQIETLL